MSALELTYMWSGIVSQFEQRLCCRLALMRSKGAPPIGIGEVQLNWWLNAIASRRPAGNTMTEMERTGFTFEHFNFNCALSTNPLSQPIVISGNLLVQLIELCNLVPSLPSPPVDEINHAGIPWSIWKLWNTPDFCATAQSMCQFPFHRLCTHIQTLLIY